MSDVYAEAVRRNERRQEILAKGVGLADLQEYEVLTLKLAEAVPTLLRAITDVIAFKDELLADESTVSAVSRAFAEEIDRALKGQRR